MSRRNRKQMMEDASAYKRGSATSYHDSMPGWLRNLESDFPFLRRNKTLPYIEKWQIQQRKKREEAAKRRYEIEMQRIEASRRKRDEARKRNNKRKGNKKWK